jgi:hypothetical protein
MRGDKDQRTDSCAARNCNTYADALCQLLLGKPIPGYVNRAAYLGSFLSCLMPADMTDQAPVGDPNAPQGIGNGAPRRSDFVYTPFSGELLVWHGTRGLL